MRIDEMKCRVNRLTMRAFLARALSYSAVAALSGI
jgi:hypothetical protein